MNRIPNHQHFVQPCLRLPPMATQPIVIQRGFSSRQVGLAQEADSKPSSHASGDGGFGFGGTQATDLLSCITTFPKGCGPSPDRSKGDLACIAICTNPSNTRLTPTMRPIALATAEKGAVVIESSHPNSSEFRNSSCCHN